MDTGRENLVSVWIETFRKGEVEENEHLPSSQVSFVSLHTQNGKDARYNLSSRTYCDVVLHYDYCLPHRSLVQIKSHAQKVLKRQDAGENIFRRLEENCREIDTLVDRASCQRDALVAGIKFNTTAPPKSFSTAAKRKRQANRSQPVDRKDEKSGTIRQSTDVPVVLDMEAEGEVESGQAVIAAAALCQLSSLAAPWDQQGVINPIEQLSEL